MEKVKQIGKHEVYWKGEWNDKLFDKCAAVVGSRRMTQYGQRVVEKLVPILVHDGWTIVSGFMYGVDQAAHRVCLECGGRTIAVLGWGINWKMEDTDLKLAKEIVSNGGLMISEWKDQPGTLWTFPARNRIVAAISQRIYVVEAASRSGALITAEMGRELGREIWAVPGPITSSVSVGTNKLIADGLARIWIGPTSPEASSGLRDNRFRSSAKIYTMLQNEALTVDELVRVTGRSAQEVGSELTMMMLAGDVVEKDGMYTMT